MLTSEQIDNSAPDPLNTIVNSRLRSAIRAMLYSENKRNLDGFLRVFLESDLIVLTLSPPISEKTNAFLSDEEGFNYYKKGTQIPLVQLTNEIGKMILPVFTESCQVHLIDGLQNFHGLLLSSPHILEMAIESGSNSVCINPGSEEEFGIERESLINIIDALRSSGALSQNPSVTMD